MIKAIKKLNTQKNSLLKFKDFVNLKTFGMDDFSRAKRDVLEGMIPENDVRRLQKEFLPEKEACKEDEKLYVNALRWKARGLKTELSIRKVKTDQEVRNNMM